MASELIRRLSEEAPRELDLTDPGHLATIRYMAGAIQARGAQAGAPGRLDSRLAGEAAVPISVRVALKLAHSRQLFEEIADSVHVSLVIAVYKEHVRILTSDKHPAGEDFLREKLRQLRWLFEGTPRHSWDLTIVDDGCPEGSGRLAQAVLNEYARPHEETKVLFLEDAIRARLPIVGDLESTDQSRKGGSIRYGLWEAVRETRGAGHMAVFTDADLSTHLGQLGLLAGPLTDPAVFAAIGSRRDPASVVVKAGKRNVRGKLFIYLWKRLIPELRGIVDTQCGFKAFDAHNLRSWVLETRDSGFSFDIELLAKLELHSPGSIRTVPVAWIDSEAASTTVDLEPYLPMLQSIARMYRAMLKPSPRGDAFASLIERLDRDSFQRLVQNVPPEIASREPAEFDDFHAVRAEHLAEACLA